MSPRSAGQQWTIATLLASLSQYLAQHHIDSPRLDAELLIGHVLGRERIGLYTHFDQPVTDAERAILRDLAKRRCRGEPIAYLLGHKEFYGRTFAVNQDVLVPRPETEHVVEAAIAWHRHKGGKGVRICDVGTGSGAIGITLACEIEDAQVILTDLSEAALQVAQRNAASLGVSHRVHCVVADLMRPRSADQAFFHEPFDMIVSNPPYIATHEMAELPRDVAQFEPHLALHGGPQGLDCLRALCRTLASHLSADAFVALEMGCGQGQEVRAALGLVLPHLTTLRDLAGHERVVTGWHDESFAQ